MTVKKKGLPCELTSIFFPRSSENLQFSDDFRGNRSSLIRLNLLTIEQLWRRSLKSLADLSTQNWSKKFVKCYIHNEYLLKQIISIFRLMSKFYKEIMHLKLSKR